MINFCTNYAPVKGVGYVAGGIAHSGETKSFTKRDFASIVVSTGKVTFKLMQDISMWDDLYNQKFDVRNEEMIVGMHAKVAAALPTTRGPLAGSEVLIICITFPVKNFVGLQNCHYNRGKPFVALQYSLYPHTFAGQLYHP